MISGKKVRTATNTSYISVYGQCQILDKRRTHIQASVTHLRNVSSVILAFCRKGIPLHLMPSSSITMQPSATETSQDYRNRLSRASTRTRKPRTISRRDRILSNSISSSSICCNIVRNLAISASAAAEVMRASCDCRWTASSVSSFSFGFIVSLAVFFRLTCWVTLPAEVAAESHPSRDRSEVTESEDSLDRAVVCLDSRHCWQVVRTLDCLLLAPERSVDVVATCVLHRSSGRDLKRPWTGTCSHGEANAIV